MSQFATHRHPQFWDDAEAFDPARFSSERERARHSHAYFPFGGGTRRCLGMAFANYEMKVVLATILSRFELRAASSLGATHTQYTAPVSEED